ncbi:MAG: hypothetical protein QOF62_1815 [Pyrinomonadaceae bacterium]|jgi:hypothetical protein|nr:hypothetical protein [Pyrinomonadaceae bacterium]
MSKRFSWRISFAVLVAAIVSACYLSPPRSVSAPPQNNVAATPSEIEHAERKNVSGIRAIDFSNFTYPWLRDLGKPTESFTLRGGKYEATNDNVPMQMFSVVYGDVTGDGQEEALVALDVIVEGGSAAPNVIYIYATEGTKPKLLWAFATGDRTDGGLRRVYPENGMLVVELYGRGKIIGTDLFADDGTSALRPLPFYYTRARYRWNGAKFQRKGPAETLSDPDRYGIPIMPAFRSG